MDKPSIKNDDNVVKLAEEIVESMDLKDIVSFMVEKLINDFEAMGQAEFEEEWNNFYNPESDEG
jgi:hypothetical protein